ncbi:MAG TPA: hypothetical protein VLM11_16595, partial [Streptosporangiaceae bacterium]|nr:hypothetical protein [Streptosporangiaceae bacterium]
MLGVSLRTWVWDSLPSACCSWSQSCWLISGSARMIGMPSSLAGVAAGPSFQQLQLVAQPSGPPDDRLVGAGAAAGAGVPGGSAVWAGHRHAPPRRCTLGEHRDQVPARSRVDRAVAGHLARLAPAGERRQRHGQVNRARHR